MRILFLSDNFPPESNAPATRLWEHAVRWVKLGHEVTVITTAPNFPEGKIYPGYRNRFRAVEDLDGIRVVRVWTYIAANEGFARRTLDYVSFMCSAVVAGIFEKRPDVVVATSPQFFCACAGWLLSALRSRPFVFELRDLWPASIAAVGAVKNKLVLRWLERIELFLYRRATAVVSVTTSFKEDLVGRGIAVGKIHVVMNGVDLTRYSPRSRSQELEQDLGLNGKFVVGYVGTHGMAHALDKIIDAAVRLKERNDVAFMFVGGGAERSRIEQLAATLELSNVVMVPRQPKERMANVWSLCDLALVPLRDDPVFSTVIPSKIFECMAMGVPVLASIPDGEATDIIIKTACGVCVPPEDPGAMAAAITRLADDSTALQSMRNRAISAAARYSRDRFAADMIDALQGARFPQALHRVRVD